MRETGIAEWRGERGGNADQEQGEEDAARREDGGHFLTLWCREEEICETGYGSERGLNGVQHQRVGESLCRGVWFGGACRPDGIAGCGDRFLEDSPRETFDC